MRRALASSGKGALECLLGITGIRLFCLVAGKCVRSAEQFAPAFLEIERSKAQALYVIDDPIFFAHRMTLLQLAAAARFCAAHVRFRGQSGHGLVHCTCLLLTQSGHSVVP